MIIVQLAGHLGADPETRYTPNGQKVTTLRLATNARKAGKDETVWWRITIWGDRFDKLIPHLKKGSAIIAIGEMGKPEIYQDKSGNPQVSMELTAEMIRFSPFGGRSDRQEANEPGSQFEGAAAFSTGSQESRGQFQQRGFGMTGAANSPKSSDFDEDEIPF